MTAVSYTDAPVPVRGEFSESHGRFWSRLARPGAWFTGTERVAIAAEARRSRNCGLCRERKEALSPSHVDGAHDSVTDLSAVIVEVIHRVTTDPGRLTRKWFDGIMDQGLTPEQYVEIIGTLVSMISVDDFCYAIGIDEHPLPAPETGEPSRYRPASAVPENFWVPSIPQKAATGAEADLWTPRAGGNVIRAMSLVPDEVRTLRDMVSAHYVPGDSFMDYSGAPFGTLSRMQMEVIAGRVSALNGCFY